MNLVGRRTWQVLAAFPRGGENPVATWLDNWVHGLVHGVLIAS